MMVSQMAMPREVHLYAVLHVFSFLRQKYNSRMAFDPTYTAINILALSSGIGRTSIANFNKPYLLIPLSKGEMKFIYVGIFIAAAQEKIKRRSRSKFFIFLNTALIQWLSKKKSTI